MEYSYHLKHINRVCRGVFSPLSSFWLYVSIHDQKLYVYRGCFLERFYTISTSAYGVNNIENSWGTPLGLHLITDKIGKDVPFGSVFIGRKDTGKVFEEYVDWKTKGYVTTRIFRLKGLEPGRNLGGRVDTYARYVYIHGVPNEAKIGSPQTKGCIGMRNADVIELFERVPEKSLVLIAYK